MQIIIHRINKISALLDIPQQYGVEVDVRAYGNRLILNHEPFVDGDNLDEYLKKFKHAFIIFNIKEAGIEAHVIELAKKYGINNYFLLDVESYWIHQAIQGGFRNIAIRYSENEPLNMALNYKGKADWLWIDIPTKLPLSVETVEQIRDFKTCLVCPERWNRPHEIRIYIQKIIELKLNLDAVMTSLKYAGEWELLAEYYKKIICR